MGTLPREKKEGSWCAVLGGGQPGAAAVRLAGSKASYVIGSRGVFGFLRPVLSWMWATVGEAVSQESSPGSLGWFTPRVLAWFPGLWLEIMV